MRHARWIVLILALAALVRFPRLGADIPLAAEPTNAPSLDAFWYLEGASSRADGVRLEASPAYDLEPWVTVARGWFFVFGCGYEQACALGATVALLTILAVFLIARRLGDRVAISAGLLLAISFAFVQQSRTAIIYGPVALAMTLTALVYVRGTRWCRCLAWCLAIAVPIVLKAHAAALLGGLVLAEVLGAPRTRGRIFLSILVAGMVVACALLLVDPLGFVSLNKARLANYAGDTSLAGLLERGLRLGSRPLFYSATASIGNGFAELSPAISILAAIGFWLAWIDRPRLAERQGRSLAVLLGWVATFALASVPIDYRPVRYAVPVLPAAALLAGYAVVRLLGGPPAGNQDSMPSRTSSIATLGVAAILGAFFGAHAVDLVGALLRSETRTEWIAAGAFAGSGIMLVAQVVRLELPRSLTRLLAISLISLAPLDLMRDVTALARPTWSIVRARRTAREILAPKAVLGGPYASVLAIGTHFERRRGARLGGENATPEELAATLQELGYTHFAVDVEQQWRFALEDRLRAAKAAPHLVAVLYLRNEPVFLYRFAWAEEFGYTLSPFERARLIEETRGSECAEKEFEAAGLDVDLVFARVRALVHGGHGDAAPAVVRTAISRLPDERELGPLLADVEHLFVDEAAITSVESLK